MDVAAAAEGRSSQEASNAADSAAVRAHENDAGSEEAIIAVNEENKFQKAIAAWRSQYLLYRWSCRRVLTPASRHRLDFSYSHPRHGSFGSRDAPAGCSRSAQRSGTEDERIQEAGRC